MASNYSDSAIGWKASTLYDPALYTDSNIGWITGTLVNPVVQGVTSDSDIGWVAATFLEPASPLVMMSGTPVAMKRWYVKTNGGMTPIRRFSIVRSGVAVPLSLHAGATWSPAMMWEGRPSRPTGSTWTDTATGRSFDLIRYEDVYQPGDTFWQTVARVTGGKVLTLPEGIFEWSDFTMGDPGYLWYGMIIGTGTGAATGCKGFMGSGPGTVLRMAERTSTKAQSLANPSESGSNINHLNQILFNHCDDALLCNLTIEGLDQDTIDGPTYYNGVSFARCMRSTVAWVTFKGAANGWRNGPPGESFPLQFYDTTGTVSFPWVHDSEIDGRRSDGTRASASLLSFNGPNGGRADRVWAHHSLSGHALVYWLSGDCSTEDYWATDIGYSNSSGDQLGLCINHEQAKGTITHTRPHLVLNGKYSTASGHTQNPGMHLSAWSTTDQTQIIIIDPANDNGPSGTGILSIDARTTYGGGGIPGAGYNVLNASNITVTKDGLVLGKRIKSSKTIVGGDTPTNTVDVYNVTFWS